MSQPQYIPPPAGDFALPFDLPRAGVRGRLIRLEASSARALSAHLLPENAARVAGETLALAAILGTALKLDGRLTVQTKSDGPLDLITADYYGSDDQTSRGVRGFARLDDNRFAALADKSFAALAGKGSLAITIEPRRGDKAYQGIVELSPDGIAASAQTYFAQSEQLPTRLRLAAAPLYTPGNKQPAWRSAGMMLQVTPDAKRSEDDWERLSLILATLEDIELLDSELSPETLLWRLFHEDEVRVQPAEPLTFRCDCDTDRIVSILKSYAPAEREGLADPDGIIRAKCDFCRKVPEVTPAAL